MLIKLIPPLAEPTIHFSLSFPDLPQHLPIPASWMSQYNHLILEDLEVPNTTHSLDRAAGLPSIIDEVAFDLSERRVRCLFVDGVVEEWDMGLEGDEAKHLQEIVGFVQDSTMEDERDKEREREKEREKERDRERAIALQHKTTRSSRFSYSSPSLVNSKVIRHKKQRSFFMQIVSSLGSIINLSSPPSPHMPPFSFSDPETPTQVSSSLLPNQRAKALRRAARSGLVDTFRRFVLPVLIRRVPFAGPYNGFCAWILWSMKRRAIERREQILVECGLTSEMLEHAMEEAFEATTMDVPSSLSDSETESFEASPVEEGVPSLDDDNGTEYTDGSSLRTPSMLSHSDYAKSKCKKTRMSISSDTFTYRSSTSMSTASSTSSAEAVQICEPPIAVSQSPLPHSKSQISLLPPPLPPKHPHNYKAQLLQTHLPPHLYAEHIHLVALSQRVEGLIAFRETQTRVALEEQRARMEILSVRGRRRAWSAGVKIRGAVGQEGQGQEWGFAIPFRSSPLARYGWVVGGGRGLQRCGDGVDEDDDGEETDVADEDCEDEFLGASPDADDMLELDEDNDPFRSSPSPSSNGISVSGFPVTRQRSNVPYRRSSTPPTSNTVEGRERKHHRSWQKTSTITVPTSEPVITTSRNSYPNPNLHLQNNRPVNANRRRAPLGPSSLPLSRLFPVSEELEVEMDVREDDMDLEMGLGGFGCNRDYAGYGMRRRGRISRSPSFSDDADQDEGHGQGGMYPTFNSNNHNFTHDLEEEDEGQYPTRHCQDDFPASPTSTASLSSMSSNGSASFGRSSSPPFTFESRSPSPPPMEYDRARDSPSPPADRRREAFELERPQVLPRVRTRSFGVVGGGQAQSQPQPRRSLWGEHREGKGLALSRDSLLCQPLIRRGSPPAGDIVPSSEYWNDEEDGEESDDEDFPFDSPHFNPSSNVSTVDKMMRISFGRTEFPMPLPNAAQAQSSSSIGNGKVSPVGIPSGVTPEADAEEVQVNPPLPPLVDVPQPQPSQPQPQHPQKTHHSYPSYPPRFMAPAPSDGLGSGEEFTLAMDVTCKIPSLGGGRKGAFGSPPSRILPAVPMLSPPPMPAFKEKLRSPPLSYAFSPRHEGVVHIPRPRPKLGDLFPIDAGVEVEVGLAPPAGLVSIDPAC